MSEEAAPNLSAEQVAHYLSEHPDFFVDHEPLLLGMHLPHTAQGTISLVERQAGLLRERASLLERTLRDLNGLAQTNESLAKRMHQLTLALLSADGPCEMIEAVRTRLCSDFDLAGVLIALDQGHALVTTCLTPPQEAAWAPLFELQKAQVVRSGNDLRDLLENNGLPETASLAAIPLHGQDLRGAMLLVKREPQGFRPDMGTLFLEQIGELVSTALAHSH